MKSQGLSLVAFLTGEPGQDSLEGVGKGEAAADVGWYLKALFTLTAYPQTEGDGGE
jgi:hypothetical protein